MINKIREKEVILLDEKIIGTNPFALKELILRGYRVMAVSPSCGQIEVECFHSKTLSNEKEITMQKERQ